MTNSSGAVVNRHEFWPYGEEITSQASGQQMKFTGHERDLGILVTQLGAPAIGDDLDYMHARYYSPVTGKFLTVDPILGTPKKPQGWNRYSYVRGNPFRLIDPDGRSDYDSLNPDEKRTILGWALLFGVRDAKVTADSVARTAEAANAQADRLFEVNDIGGRTDDSPYNAFRHAVWSCMLSCAIGPVKATWFTTAHETGDSKGTQQQHEMDLANNSTGIDLATPAVCMANSCSAEVETALDAGRLQTAPEPPPEEDKDDEPEKP